MKLCSGTVASDFILRILKERQIPLSLLWSCTVNSLNITHSVNNNNIFMLFIFTAKIAIIIIEKRNAIRELYTKY